MAFVMWDSLAAGPGGQGCDWNGVNLRLAGSSSTEISIPAANLRDLMILLLDTAVAQEGRQSEGDKYVRARNALSGSASATLSGFSAAQTTGRGTVLNRTDGSINFDVGEAVSFCTMLASLCQSSLKTESGLLMRA